MFYSIGYSKSLCLGVGDCNAALNLVLIFSSNSNSVLECDIITVLYYILEAIDIYRKIIRENRGNNVLIN